MMIPFGPWLAIGFLAALWLNHPAVALAQRYWENIQAAWDYRPDLLMIGGGLILVGGGAGLFLARLIRRRIEARMS
ncbi:MAG: hypothetical protein KKB50_18135 [Planctomycetes bacterium]|nr:hypothetical protein [Planctomycetota bacterium]